MTTLDEQIGGGEQPRCPDDGIVLRDTEEGFTCPDCGFQLRVDQIALPQGFSGPDIDSHRP